MFMVQNFQPSNVRHGCCGASSVGLWEKIVILAQLHAQRWRQREVVTTFQTCSCTTPELKEIVFLVV